MKPETRKKVEAFILKWVGKYDLSGENSKIYKKMFADMSDKQLEELVKKPIPIYAPNGGNTDIDHMRGIEICRELGTDPEQYCWLTDPKTGAVSRTTHKHLVLPVPVRRQTQLIQKKVSIAKHNRTIDKATGQVTGPSKGSRFSFPQVYTMFAKGYDSTIREFMQTRGGDIKAGKIIDRNIRQNGHSSQKFDGYDRTHVKSTKVLGILFKTCHIKTKLGENNNEPIRR